METTSPPKHWVRTSTEFYLEEKTLQAFEALRSGIGYLLVRGACDIEKDCREPWENCLANKDKDGFLGDESVEKTIFLSTILNPITDHMIHQAGSVLLVPQKAMVHFRKTSQETPVLSRIKGVPLYSAEDQPLVLMKMQFSGGPDEMYRVLLAGNSHKMGSKEGVPNYIDIRGGDELFYNGGLRISYPQYITPNGDRAYTNHAMYLVRFQGLEITSGLGDAHVKRLLTIGGSRVKHTNIGKFPNIEWL
ncbi:MAG: hypothetical protein M1840_003096 [Geoglossum simile]|nr:MAG: hypothetical protein M1840_003096 [Geoglossum simile]